MDIRVKSEKEELLDKRIEEVRKRNEARLKKFQEAEEDRKRAEEAGRAVNMKNSSFLDDDYHKYRGHQKAYHQKNENQKSKRHVSETQEEQDNKNVDNTNRVFNEENNNNNNNNNSGQSNHNISKKERTPKSNIRAIYVPKHLQNRDSPENVKPPPPDPRNSFLADSYRTPTSTNTRNGDHIEHQAKEESPDTKVPFHIDGSRITPKQAVPFEVGYQGSDQRRQQSIPLTSQSTFHGDARQRINQLKAIRNQENQGTPFSNPPILKDRPATEPHRPPSHHLLRNRPHNFKINNYKSEQSIQNGFYSPEHPRLNTLSERNIPKEPFRGSVQRCSLLPRGGGNIFKGAVGVTRESISSIQHARRPQPPAEEKPTRLEKVYRGSSEKPIKSILKKSQVPIVEFDDSQPIMAVITTPGEDVNEEEEEEEEGGAGAQGYDHKKQEAICDWLKNSEFDNDEGGDDDEWEDVDEEAEEENAINGQSESSSAPAVEKVNVTQERSDPNPNLENDDKLEAFEEDNAAFQEFIKQHTLTLDGEDGFDWATEMERLSLENKRKIDPEVLERAASKE